MARARMITRTVTTVSFKVMVVNMETLSVEHISVSVPSADTMTDKVVSEKIKEKIPEGFTFVKVVDSVKTEKIYGMTEEDFLYWAHEIER